MEMNIGFLASGGGSNVRAILKSIDDEFLDATPKFIFTNNVNSGIIPVAAERKIPFTTIGDKNVNPATNKEIDYNLSKLLPAHGVDLVVLAGYLRKIGPKLLEAYPNRILNIHPALLPKYGGKGMHGMHVHEAVIASNDTQSGATIHLVNENYDEGRILSQYAVPRYAEDVPQSLQERVLRVEHALYSQVLKDIQTGKIDLDA